MLKFKFLLLNLFYSLTKLKPTWIFIFMNYMMLMLMLFYEILFYFDFT